MIKTEAQLKITKKVLEDTEYALIALKEKVLDINPEKYYLMATPYVESINKLRKEINDYLGITAVEEQSIPLWIRLEGKNIGAGVAPIDLLASFLNNFKLGTQRVVEYLYNGNIRDVGRPPEKIRQLSNFKVKIASGSLRIGISFPSSLYQKTLGGEHSLNLTKEAVVRILEGVSWATGRDPRDIEDIFPIEKERHLLLEQVDNISPQPDEEIKRIEFKGKMLKRGRLLLVPKSAIKIKEEIYKPSSKRVIEEGYSRAIDIDKFHFSLRNRQHGKRPITCYYDEKLKIEAKEALHRESRVRVTGNLIKPKKGKSFINVDHIELL